MAKHRLFSIELLIASETIFYHYHWSLIFITHLPRLAFLTATMYAEASPITLPFTGEMVSLCLDGQNADFLIDTGSYTFFTIFGPEYERLNGNGSCKDNRVCYFCPPSNPCDDIFNRKRWRVTFEDDEVYRYVEHTVSLTIDGIEIPNFKIGVAIKFHKANGEKISSPVRGLLGLSYGQGGMPETFLEQLKRRKVISSLKYWVRADQDTSSFDGNLILDDPTRTDSHTLRLSTDSDHFKMLPIWPVQLLSPQGRFVKQNSNRLLTKRLTSILVIVDTGAEGIYLPNEDFELFYDAAKEYLLADTRYSFFSVNRPDVQNLPTLFYGIGNLNMRSAIKIQPKHYVQCDVSDTCFVRIISWPNGPYAFGRPFFHAYDVGFDLESYPPFIYLKAKDADNEVESIV